MNILLSTNAFIKTGFNPLKELLSNYGTFKFGLELFPNFENENFEKELLEIRDIIKDRPLSMHGPYFKVEHTAEKGTESYDYAMEQIEQTLRVCEDLNINQLVIHHNNKKIKDENACVYDKENVLFNEKEFIEMCKEEGNNVLIDIGHVNANKWSLENIITSLKNQITHYHLHNNSAGRDDHNRIHDGSLDF